MRPEHPADRARRGFLPRLEGLEAREVPSTTAMLASGALLPASRAAAPSAGSPSSASYTIPLRMSRFQARFQGGYVIGGPRAPVERSQLYMFGGGNSNAFLHADLQLGLSTPADPSLPTVGQAVIMLKDISNTGNELVLDLTAVPGAVDRRGRPTQFAFTQADSSGGSFTNGAATGTMTLIYSPGKYPGVQNVKQARGTGNLGVIFRGSIGTVNLFDTLRNQ
ncbi:hypothetical protein OJF2_08230 [Aquisphaera giovannonii]|uniref:Uncharacterized protein n=1 Tax=Aquisphaera giovannonii TaxID=406548 RepID=A0A5B9VVH8_9BACT|nr:hypothetical protein [Aquisphaera giovannonii]QEH32353.1 hypothetical protein OJF2_08230 [Aquisphaera giovannonii]